MENRPDFTYEQVVWIFKEIEQWYLDWQKTGIDGKMNFEKEGEIQSLHAKESLLKILAFDKSGELNFTSKTTFHNIPVEYRSYILNIDETLSCPYCGNLVKK